MSKLDEMIEQALSAEDQALLQSHGEPGYFKQAFGLFRGPLAWVVWLMYLVATVAFGFGVYALWQMYLSSDAADAVKWGVAALVLMHFTFMGKNFMGAHLEANRTLREIKRLELQLARLRAGG